MKITDYLQTVTPHTSLRTKILSELHDVFHHFVFGIRDVRSPLSVIDGKNIHITDVVTWLIVYYKPPTEARKIVIFDPTCGVTNYQFQHRFWRSRRYEKYNYVYIAADIKREAAEKNKGFASLTFTYDLFHRIPLRDNSVDIIIYDPPFVTTGEGDERSEEYNIDTGLGVGFLERFHSRRVYEEFHRVLRESGILIVRGKDVNYPPVSNHHFLFLHDLLGKEKIKGLFEVLGLYIYRYYKANEPLIRRRLRRLVRPMYVHSYIVVLKALK